ncbi:MAG TPA: immunoglobulin domain-containing protein [Methylomirabilota bacterium]|nr:immunoglobulin domain-containing protein [Methylomirabilota bacterium]
MKLKHQLLAMLTAGMLGAPVDAATIPVTGMITSAVTWQKTNEYVLNGFVYVMHGATLTIEPGTVIKAKRGQDANTSALIVTAGGKIFANGTPTEPIIFTSEEDDISDPNDLGAFERGLWGGVVLLGKSVLNTATDASGNAAARKYDVFEGLPDMMMNGQFVHRFGGNDDNDNSGVLRYVSIRHAGVVFQPNKELNGLSLGAVGRGTAIEYVETYATADDGFEFFGGTVNTKYLVSAFNDDDAFDTDQGYRGKNQFWFAIQEPGWKDHGAELNGEPNGAAVNAAPVAAFEVANATWIGAGTNSTGNRAMTIREYAAPKFYNSIFTEFGGSAVRIDAKSATHIAGGVLELANNMFWNFATNGNPVALPETAEAQIFFTNTAYANVNSNPNLRGIGRAKTQTLDPRPRVVARSSVFTGIRELTNAFYTPVAYKGAFGPVDLWVKGWTALDQLGFIGATPVAPFVTSVPENQTVNAGANVTFNISAEGDAPLTYQWSKGGVVIPGQTGATLQLNSVTKANEGVYTVVVTNSAGLATREFTLTVNVPAPAGKVTVNQPITGNVTWSSSNVYVLDGFVYVLNGASLTIEAGTVIKARRGQDANTSALIVTAGGKIFANGTATAPIIFTSEDDDVTDPTDLGLFERGLWGGIVILGKSVLNTATDTTGNAAAPKYDVFEGLPDAQVNGQFVHRFGGNDDNDNSGVLRYVSIRHAGVVFQPNKELNGLSLGAVGRGTTIEFVETYATADDGFEFFGGTVNTKHLISAFNDDDAFDTDQGYRGKNQFWFAIQERGKKDHGGELNGEPNGAAVNATPVAAFEVRNATWIGAGTNTTGNRGMTIREYAAPKFKNSIFTEFGGNAVRIDAKSATHIAAGTLDLRDNLFWNFATNGTAVALAETAEAQIFFTDSTRGNRQVDPQLRGISRTNNAALDPRPAIQSIAATGAAAASDSFYTAVPYYGAFGSTDLWARGWTALDSLGFLSQAVITEPPVAPTLAASYSNGNIAIRFASQVGKQYQLQSRSALGSGAWSNEGAVAVGASLETTLTVAATGDRRFFWVVAQ